MITVLQGELGLLIFDEQGEITEKMLLSGSGSNRGVNIPAGVFHSLVVLSEQATILEVKEGPYDAGGDKDFLTTTPTEGEAGTGAFVQAWMTLFG